MWYWVTLRRKHHHIAVQIWTAKSSLVDSSKESQRVGTSLDSPEESLRVNVKVGEKWKAECSISGDVARSQKIYVFWDSVLEREVALSPCRRAVRSWSWPCHCVVAPSAAWPCIHWSVTRSLSFCTFTVAVGPKEWITLEIRDDSPMKVSGFFWTSKIQMWSLFGVPPHPVSAFLAPKWAALTLHLGAHHCPQVSPTYMFHSNIPSQNVPQQRMKWYYARGNYVEGLHVCIMEEVLLSWKDQKAQRKCCLSRTRHHANG